MELWEDALRAGLNWLRQGRVWQQRAVDRQSLGGGRPLVSEGSTVGRPSEQELALLLGVVGRPENPGKKIRQGLSNLNRPGGGGRPQKRAALPALPNLPAPPDLVTLPGSPALSGSLVAAAGKKNVRGRPPVDLAVRLPAFTARPNTGQPPETAAEAETDGQSPILADWAVDVRAGMEVRNSPAREMAGEAQSAAGLAAILAESEEVISRQSGEAAVAGPADIIAEASGPPDKIPELNSGERVAAIPVANRPEPADDNQRLAAAINLTEKAARETQLAVESRAGDSDFLTASAVDLDGLADLVAERLCDDIEAILNSSSLV